MTQEQVYELVGRYMNGETTLAEERRLYEYFREKKDLPQSLHTYRELMLDMDAADGVETGYEAWPASLPRQESRGHCFAQRCRLCSFPQSSVFPILEYRGCLLDAGGG